MRFKEAFVILALSFGVFVQGNSILSNQNCGKIYIPMSARGPSKHFRDMPWTVVFKHRENNDDKVFCLGSLIAPKTVVSGEKSSKIKRFANFS